MASNVLSWNDALEKGYESRLYPYTTEDVPLGCYQAVLNFKIWAKKAMAICCYFSQKGTGKQFQLTVYRRQIDKLYRLEKEDIDFRVCPDNEIYTITVVLNGKQNVALKTVVASVE